MPCSAGAVLGGPGRDTCPSLAGRLRLLHPWPEHVCPAWEWLDDSWKGAPQQSPIWRGVTEMAAEQPGSKAGREMAVFRWVGGDTAAARALAATEPPRASAGT